MQGGTFTISNGGVYGSLMSTPILNAPQSGILGMHKIQDRPVVVGGQIVIRPMMYLALPYDHRIVDGKEAVTFLVRVKESLGTPRAAGAGSLEGPGIRTMPILAVRVDGLKIQFYADEHPPPHFHAEFAEFRAAIEIDTLRVVKELPAAGKLVVRLSEWASARRPALRSTFESRCSRRARGDRDMTRTPAPHHDCRTLSSTAYSGLFFDDGSTRAWSTCGRSSPRERWSTFSAGILCELLRQGLRLRIRPFDPLDRLRCRRGIDLVPIAWWEKAERQAEMHCQMAS